MLSDRERELIHGDVDGSLDATERDALATLLASNADAAALHADLRRLDGVFARVPAREPSPALQAALLAAIPSPPRATAAAPVVDVRWNVPPRVSLFTLAVRRMEEVLMSRKLFLIGATSVAIIAIVAGRIFPIPSTGHEVGTIGGSEIDSSGRSGVQKADRYRGRTMTNSDVTIANPQIATLFQNQDVLTLVKSEAFREAMKSDAFRDLQANEQFRLLSKDDAFVRLMSSDAFAQLMQSDAYLKLAANDASFAKANDVAAVAKANDLSRKVDAKSIDARNLAAQALEREASKIPAYRTLTANAAFREVLANDAYRQILANDAFREVLANAGMRRVFANDAFRVLSASEAYRNATRSSKLADAFLNEAAGFSR